ncbi:hypothetical protein NUG13_12370 [Bacillus subtilis]|uniref:hypothetical protein n=1 Tax=Bacillus subtilis group TaxID=653685 RepID=UPI0020102C01|nr:MULTISPECIES: hypothetical protein [Bacillus subtilis group]MCR4362125.1 hypothetical protein [Bacillus subtilis]UQB84271.1 hypothetical protein KMZ31_20370 [Bacillus amyloliquefaciens]
MINQNNPSYTLYMKRLSDNSEPHEIDTYPSLNKPARMAMNLFESFSKEYDIFIIETFIKPCDGGNKVELRYFNHDGTERGK